MTNEKSSNIAVSNFTQHNITSERTSSRDLAELVSRGIFEQIGTTGKGTAYILRRHLI